MTQRNSGSMKCRLGSVVPSAKNEDERTATRRRYWESTGVLVIMPDDLKNDFDRQWAKNMAAQIFQKKKPSKGAE